MFWFSFFTFLIFSWFCTTVVLTAHTLMINVWEYCKSNHHGIKHQEDSKIQDSNSMFLCSDLWPVGSWHQRALNSSLYVLLTLESSLCYKSILQIFDPAYINLIDLIKSSHQVPRTILDYVTILICSVLTTRFDSLTCYRLAGLEQIPCHIVSSTQIVRNRIAFRKQWSSCRKSLGD